MHGRKKVTIDEAERIKDAQKAKKLKQLTEECMESISNPEKIEEYITSTNSTQLLIYINDFATLWNRHKEYVLAHTTDEVLDKELKLTFSVLQKDPKAYWAWHHRRWCAELKENFDYLEEIKLCNRCLDYDCRNFHVWRHRRWAVSKCNDEQKLEELNYSYTKIQKNISNFSAWHYRSQLVQKENYLDELTMAKEAFWTDPNDQCGWIYYRWLLSKEEIRDNEELIQEEIENMDELILEEPNSKYPLLAGIWLQRILKNPDESKINEFKDKLKIMDPIRSSYYEEQ